MVSQAAMRGQRVVESVFRCWNPAVWLLVSLLGSLLLVAVSLLLRLGDLKITRRAVHQNPARMQFQVHLVKGRNRCEGRLEVSFNGSRGTVCDDHWDMVDAKVVCRQLGCGLPWPVKSSAQFGRGDGLIALDNVDCGGEESDLSQCRSLGWGIHNCYHYEDVGVTCRAPPGIEPKGFEDHTTPPQGTSGLRDGTIRLMDGPHSCAGRVEIYYRGKWGTVCDDDWNILNAQVVCQQIGCGNATSAPTNSFFGHTVGLIYLDNVQCIGTELELSKCKSLGWGQHNCRHHEDAGVKCTGSTAVTPATTQLQRRFFETINTHATEEIPVTEDSPTTTIVTTPPLTIGKRAIRLVNGNSSCQGRVEVWYRNVWGTVCDDDWGIVEANVVCRQLGCGPAIGAMHQAYFGYGSGPILLDNVDCRGEEAELFRCFHLGWGQHNCGHHEDAGVMCLLHDIPHNFTVTERIPATTSAPTPPPPADGTMRLVNGQHPCEGRVEIYLNSSWGTVCDDAWDLPDAQVVCFHLGCGDALVAYGEAYFGAGTGPIQMDNLKCVGHEPSLLECSHISWDVHNCDHLEDASVICSLS